MILIGEAIQRLQSDYSKGVQSKDTRLTSRHIYSALITARATLIKQQSSKSQHINSWIYQTLYFIPLQLSPINLSTFGPQSPTALRSTTRLPKLVSDINADLLSSVSTLDGQVMLSSTDYETAKYQGAAKYTGANPKRYIRDGYMFVTNATQLRGVTMQGIFEDPIEVWQYNLANYSCPDCRCKKAKDIEFPIDRDLLKTMLELAQQELIILFSQMSEDTSADAADEASSPQRGVMIHQPHG